MKAGRGSDHGLPYNHAMSPLAQQVLKQALSLDEKERASIAGVLIDSLDSEVDLDAEEAWEAEIQRRVAELDSGTVQTIPWSDVKKHLLRGLE